MFYYNFKSMILVCEVNKYKMEKKNMSKQNNNTHVRFLLQIMKSVIKNSYVS
jgi:hypothetical protein